MYAKQALKINNNKKSVAYRRPLCLFYACLPDAQLYQKRLKHRDIQDEDAWDFSAARANIGSNSGALFSVRAHKKS